MSHVSCLTDMLNRLRKKQVIAHFSDFNVVARLMHKIDTEKLGNLHDI